MGTNVIIITGTDYLFGLTEIISIENNASVINEISGDEISFDDYIIWFIAGGILIIIVIFVVIKNLKNKN